MGNTGLGQDGYFRVQKEAVYGTAITDGMTLWPVKPGSLITAFNTPIENQNIISSRLVQTPDAGRSMRTGDITLDMYPDLMGLILNILLGTSSDAADGSAYVHTWLMPITGERIAKSLTVQQAMGGDLADQFDGVMITGISITMNNESNAEITVRMVGQGLLESQTRITTFSYSSLIPFKFCHATTITVNSGGAIAVDVDSFTLDIDLGYDPDRYKLGSCEIQQLVFNTTPSVTLSMTVDAQQTFVTKARSYSDFTIDMAIISTELAGGAGEYYKLELEIPKARLAADTIIPDENDRASMDLVFNCGYGGTTTGSGATSVMAEIRLEDATAAYA
jgi:hypothetical protein